MLRATERGISVYDGDKWLIVYDDNIKTSVNRFTIAHEFGHIFLGHELKKGYYARTFDNKPEVEQAADMFAARLLAPACVLHELHATTAEKIAEICNISIQAAKHRAERMAILEARNKYYLHPLERQVRKQFEDYIKENRSHRVPISESGNHYNGCNDTNFAKILYHTLVNFSSGVYKGFLHSFLRKGVLI